MTGVKVWGVSGGLAREWRQGGHMGGATSQLNGEWGRVGARGEDGQMVRESKTAVFPGDLG